MGGQMSKTITYLGVELEIYFTVTKARRGARDSLGGIAGAGAPIEPDEPEEIIVEKILHKGEDIIDLIGEFQHLKILQRLAEVLDNEPDFD